MNNSIMNAKTRTIGVLAVGAAVIALTALSACNTWKGVGKDVERTGEAIQGDDVN